MNGSKRCRSGTAGSRAWCFGGIEHERIQLNEDTLWAGGPYDPANPQALDALPIARRLIFAGKYGEAHALGRREDARTARAADAISAGRRSPADVSRRGERRRLPAGAGPRYGGRARDVRVRTACRFVREVLSSPVDQVIAVRLTADRPGRINVTAGMSTPQDATNRDRGRPAIVMRGVNAESQGIKGALTFEARVRVVAQGGAVSSDRTSIAVDGARIR
jgi:alpha-L-fucosidase 2